MGASLGSSKGAIAELNLTPLIDIVLVVLIIMMVNIPIQIEQMGVKLPGKTEVKTTPQEPVDQLVVALYPAEQEGGEPGLALNRRLMTRDTLFNELTRRLRSTDKKNVFIDAHPDLPYGAVVDMMDLAREAGAAQVGLAKMKDSGPLPATSIAQGSMERGVFFGNPTAVGDMLPKDADAVIQPFKGQFMACYEQGLAQNPELSGRMMLRFGVGPQGELLSQKISSSNLENPTVEACIDAILPTVRFPPLGEQKTALVQVPLLFSPG